MSDDLNKQELEACGCDDSSCGCSDESCGCDGDHSHSHDGCGCGHDHGHHHHDTITLTLDDDEEVECAVLGIFDVEEQEYIALLPNDSEDVFIYTYHESEAGEVSLENIESQEDFDKVSAVFLEIIEQEGSDEDA